MTATVDAPARARPPAIAAARTATAASRGRRTGGPQLDERELRSAREDEQAHRDDLDRLQSGLAGDHAEGGPDDHGRAEDRPSFRERAARRSRVVRLDRAQIESAAKSAR